MTNAELIVTVRSPIAEQGRRNAIRRTWGGVFRSRYGVEVIFNHTNPGPERMPVLSDDCLLCPGKDRHADAANKTYLTLEWLLAHRAWDHVLFIDDDCSVDVEAFMDLPWRVCDVWGHDNGWFTSGCAAVYSRKFVEALVPVMAVDDTVIGGLAAGLGFTRVHSGGAVRPWRPRDAHGRRHDALTEGVAIQHYVRDPDRIIANHERLVGWEPPRIERVP